LGFGVWGLGFEIPVFGFRFSGSGFSIFGSRFSVFHSRGSADRSQWTLHARLTSATSASNDEMSFPERNRNNLFFYGLLPESQGQNLALTVLNVSYLLDRGPVAVDIALAVDFCHLRFWRFCQLKNTTTTTTTTITTTTTTTNTTNQPLYNDEMSSPSAARRLHRLFSS